MKTFNSNLSSYPKQISLTSLLPSLLLLSALLISCTNSATISISDKQFKKFWTYDDAQQKNIENGDFLNFTDGTWYFFQELSLLEFHPRGKGIVDFATIGFDKSIYLDAPRTVICFPWSDDSKYKNKPYIDRSKLLTLPEDKATLIFPEKPEDMGNKELVDQAFNKNLDLIFTQENLKKKVEKWNYIPYYDPLKFLAQRYSFNNDWGIFLEFPDVVNQGIDLPNITPELIAKTYLPQKWEEDKNKDILARMMKFIYFDDIDYLQEMSLSPDKWNSSYAVHLITLKKTMGVLKNYYASRMYHLFSVMNHEMMTIAIEIVGNSATSPEGEFLDYYFSDFDLKEKMVEHEKKRNGQRYALPFKPLHSQWYKRTLELSDLNTDDSIEFEGKYKATLDKFRRIMILTFENLYDVMLGEVNSINEDDVRKLKIQNKQHEQYYIEHLKSNITMENKEKHVELFRNQNFALLFADILQIFFFAPVLARIEDTFVSKVKPWGKLSRLKWDMSTDSALEKLRYYLVTMGVIPYNPEEDSYILDYSGEKIFNIKNRRLVI